MTDFEPATLLALDATSLTRGYLKGDLTPHDTVEVVLERIRDRGEDNVWIHRLTATQLHKRAAALVLNGGPSSRLPLYGLPFAIKDNIDLAGHPTTAACPDFTFIPKASATVVNRLVEAGAMPVGKTNLDQFATGLVGTRSPYGAVSSAFNPADIAGGSSSGSAVAVAAGLVTFALGTDTAGSGRVPAGCNNVVGIKPTRGLTPTTGVLPACRTLDCVSVFGLTVPDAWGVVRVIVGPDGHDAFAIPWNPRCGRSCDTRQRPITVGVPRPLEFLADDEFEAGFHGALAQLQGIDVTHVDTDFAPLSMVADLLYEGPWVAERLAAIAPFMASSADSLLPITRRILEEARKYSAVDAFQARYRLRELTAVANTMWDTVDALVVPTAPTTWRIDEVHADPVTCNSQLGHYTNFVNLLDWAAIATPAAIAPSGRPIGVTFIGPTGSDHLLARLADEFHLATGLPMGATTLAQPPRSMGARPMPPLPRWGPAPSTDQDPQRSVPIAVVGAHLRGQPLNWQLKELAAYFDSTAVTTADYRLFDLDGTRPGLIRWPTNGRRIEVEIWQVPIDRIGFLLVQIDPPLGLGTIQLDSGRSVFGFLCENHATRDARDITNFGGWINWKAGKATHS